MFALLYPSPFFILFCCNYSKVVIVEMKEIMIKKLIIIQIIASQSSSTPLGEKTGKTVTLSMAGLRLGPRQLTTGYTLAIS